MNTSPIVKDVVLIGGGHSHVLLIRLWAMNPIAGVRLTLVSDSVDTPYSGMLPGLIAGHYTPEEVHVDLARLCSWAGVRFIERRLEALDLDAKQLLVNDQRPPIGFDVLSLDTGSTPDLSVEGADQHSVPVKPVYGFYNRWLSILERIGAAKKITLGVVGSGAGGFELITAMRFALDTDVAECHWFVRGTTGLKGRPSSVSTKAMDAAKSAGIVVHTEFDVIDVNANELLASDGRSVSLDEIIWCAAAIAPPWPKQAGLSIDKRGFVYTNAHLQSVSHPFVFATGDIGTQQATPSPKAGVYAVRQAPVLFKNIRRLLLGATLKTYKPQTDFLSLMATGKKDAIGNRGPLTLQGKWVWHWKDRIDKKFMNQFSHLPEMQERVSSFKVPTALLNNTSLSGDDVANSAMRCRGCGGKVGASILDSVLQTLSIDRFSDDSQSSFKDDRSTSLDIASDAATFNTQINTISNVKVTSTFVQSVDQLSAVCEDPYLFGRIAAVHALSDVVSASAVPHSAQVIVSLPFAEKRIVKRDLQQLMAGVVDALNADGCSLVGGHTAEAGELALGFVVNGFQRDTAQSNVHTPSVGDRLILTKPIGSGVLLAGMMRQLAVGGDIQSALHSMQKSNRVAADILHSHNVCGLTDVTGFGLLGHMINLQHQSDLSDGTRDSSSEASSPIGFDVDVNAIKIMHGAKVLAEQGVGSTLLKQNQEVLQHINIADAIDESTLNILCDPQTSGGLLGIVSEENATMVVEQLIEHGYDGACNIGTVGHSAGIRLTV